MPWQLLQSSTQRWKRAWQDKFVFLPVDKNPGKPWLMCRRLLYCYVLLLYSYAEQFECLHTCNPIRQAEEKAMELPREAAGQYALDRHFRPRKRTRPPHSFVFPKNKSAEWDNITKFRILFSHFAHPMKEFGRKVGRASSVLINIARDRMPTWAILKIGEVRQYFQNAEEAMCSVPLRRGGRGWGPITTVCLN